MIHRGAMWMVDLSSQYWMALLTALLSLVVSVGFRSMGLTL